MYCAECGTANSVGAETCEVCGSPLGPSTGDQSCHVCGAPVEAHDRFCRACGQSLSGADAGRFEPGPSFVDDSTLEVNVSELPPWLREMTLSKTEKENGHVAASAAVADQVEGLPNWLDASPPANGTGRKSTPSGLPTSAAPPPASGEQAESFSLITEDDLPEWLRALGDQELEQEAPAPTSFTARASSPPTVATAAPAVSRAWLSRSRDTETESTGQIAADFAPLEAGPVASLTRRAAPQTDELPPLSSEDQIPSETPMAAPATAPSDTRRVRLIMLSVVGLLVVILLAYAVSNLL